MPTLKLGEPVVDAIIAKLRLGMAGRVAAINASAADNVTIVPPSDSDYYPFGISQIPRAPAVVVTQMPTDGEHEAEGPHSFIWVADFAVFVLEEDSDRERLARKLQRQVRAAVETLWDDDPKESLAGGVAFQLKFVRDDPGPVAEPENDESFWRAWHVAYFRVWSDEG